MTESRRRFLSFCTTGLGAVFGAILGAPAVAYIIDARNRKAPDSDLRPVRGVQLSKLDVGVPVQGVIRDVRQDAWTLHPNDVIGRVWIVRTKAGAADKTAFQVFTTECPHLGCSINLIPDNPPIFKCPCHEAEFDCDGLRRERAGYTNAAPRGMDTLDFEVTADPENPEPTNRDLLLVKYERFVQTKETKEKRT